MLAHFGHFYFLQRFWFILIKFGKSLTVLLFLKKMLLKFGKFWQGLVNFSLVLVNSLER
jgi:hypothetical protein